MKPKAHHTTNSKSALASLRSQLAEQTEANRILSAELAKAEQRAMSLSAELDHLVTSPSVIDHDKAATTAAEYQAVTNAADADEPIAADRLALHYRLNDIDRMISANYHEGYVVRRAFDFYLHPEEENYMASVPDLRRLHQWFFDTLPEAERRRATNGWEMPAEIWTWQRYRQTADGDPQEYLAVNACKDHVTSHFEPFISSSNQPLEIRIRPGAHKVDVLRAMERALNFLRFKWERAIVTDWLNEDMDPREQAVPFPKFEASAVHATGGAK